MSKGAILGQETDLKDIEQQINNIEKQISNVSNKFKNYLLLSGGTMTGPIDLGNNKITNLQNPSSGTDACNLQTVNSRINSALSGQSSSLSWKKLGSKYVSNSMNDKFTYNLSSIPFAMGVKANGKFQTMLRSTSRLYINLNDSNTNQDFMIIQASTQKFQGRGFDVSRIIVPDGIVVSENSGNFTYYYISNSTPLVIGTNTLGIGVDYGTFTGTISLYGLF